MDGRWMGVVVRMVKRYKGEGSGGTCGNDCFDSFVCS